MKKRLGFVGNSSSSSFCVWGIRVDDYCESNKLDCHAGLENYCDYIVGLDVHNIKDEETLLQFKQRIIKLLKEEFPNKDIKVEDIKCYVDGGYEG